MEPWEFRWIADPPAGCLVGAGGDSGKPSRPAAIGRNRQLLGRGACNIAPRICDRPRGDISAARRRIPAMCGPASRPFLGRSGSIQGESGRPFPYSATSPLTWAEWGGPNVANLRLIARKYIRGAMGNSPCPAAPSSGRRRGAGCDARKLCQFCRNSMSSPLPRAEWWAFGSVELSPRRPAKSRRRARPFSDAAVDARAVSQITWAPAAPAEHGGYRAVCSRRYSSFPGAVVLIWPLVLDLRNCAGPRKESG